MRDRFLVVIKSQVGSTRGWTINNEDHREILEITSTPHDLFKEIAYRSLGPDLLTVHHRGNPLIWWQMTIYRGEEENQNVKILEINWGSRDPRGRKYD